MTRSYLGKLASLESSDNKVLVPEDTTERVEVCILSKV